jgi:hypothetical protein
VLRQEANGDERVNQINGWYFSVANNKPYVQPLFAQAEIFGNYEKRGDIK